MLINCPRCGFSQPNDRYCAQCGVDTQMFKQKKQPVFRRILNNAALQIAVLIIIAIFAGQAIFRIQEPQNWVQKISPFQGVSKSKKTAPLAESGSSQLNPDDFSSTNKNQAGVLSRAEPEATEITDSIESTASSVSATSASLASYTNNNSSPTGTATQKIRNDAANIGSVNFKVTYAEVSVEILARWTTDSSNLGLYQSLQEYSAGIIYDFKKRSDTIQQTLEIVDLKLTPGNSNSKLSGTITPDGRQTLGLVTAIDYRSIENDVIRGNISVTKSTSQNSEQYPAEFELPKGSAFFIIGAIKRESFNADRTKLSMPPFQIFKSADFLTRKTEFVIIIEPDYK